MAIIRKYETKEECVELFIDDEFDGIDSTLITELDGWEEVWSFVEGYDPEEHDVDPDDVSWYDEDDGLAYTYSADTTTGAPMWNTWFVPNGFVWHWCHEHLREVAECGFTLIMHDDEFYALAVDGCGYSFRDTHFMRLYDAMGIRWHE